MQRRILDGTAAWTASEIRAFAAAVFAVVLWGLLPVLREHAASVPAMQMTALALACAALVANLSGGQRETGESGSAHVDVRTWFVLSGALVGAIVFYFLGLNAAPAAQVTLITYIWPLMFVAASEVLTVGRVRAVVLLGALIAFAGAAVLIARDWDGGIVAGHAAGYAAGLASGACWTVYSLIVRGRQALGAGFFPRLFTLGALIAGALHLWIEPTAWPIAPEAMLIAAAIGAGPYGLAFIAWAHGIRYGPVRAVGALTYAVPIIASAFLVALGLAEPSWRLVVATLAVIAGVAVTSRGSRPKAA
ncbi:EamA-like transporter family protein [Limimonas halophila]|uniref:EamA-like transporter family protein n=1 Tax=Limimonas halophila TaxID=1082479 RepID=A0A1G7TPH1_9PROT|nr:DMT family transporter [Limimonas halophila]SDG37002.1 EamA-like transporter family protein [Limimonas halophila]